MNSFDQSMKFYSIEELERMKIRDLKKLLNEQYGAFCDSREGQRQIANREKIIGILNEKDSRLHRIIALLGVLVTLIAIYFTSR